MDTCGGISLRISFLFAALEQFLRSFHCTFVSFLNYALVIEDLNSIFAIAWTQRLQISLAVSPVQVGILIPIVQNPPKLETGIRDCQADPM